MTIQTVNKNSVMMSTPISRMVSELNPKRERKRKMNENKEILEISK